MKMILLILALMNVSFAATEECSLESSHLQNLLDHISETACPVDPEKKNSSPNLEYFKQLHAKGMAASIDEFLKFWDESEKEFDQDPAFFRCQEKAFGTMKKNLVKVKGRKHLPKDCRPDVLYSWAEVVKLQNISKHLPDGQKWQGSANPFKNPEYGDKYFETALYLAQTPAMTFGYGTVLMRFKIKKEVPFIADIDRPKTGEVDYTTMDEMPDFTFTDSSVVESWSYGTTEIYDEIVRDLIRLKSNKRAQTYGGMLEKDGLEKMYIGSIDQKEFDEKTLKRNLLNLIDMILKDQGKVIYQKGSCRSRSEHYRTNQKTWFNPN